MRCIKIYGLPRTCTNITEVLIKSNFRAKLLINNPNWKHGFNTHEGRSIHNEHVDTDDLRFVICTKHPYRWLWSLYLFENRQWNEERSVDEFLSEPARLYSKLKMTAIEAFNKLNKHWLEMYSDNNLLIQSKQEELMNPDGQLNFCQRIENAFTLERNSETLSSIPEFVRPFAQISDNVYADKGHEFTDAQLRLVNAKLDHSVAAMAGYELYGL